jgi:hypothetical protein
MAADNDGSQDWAPDYEGEGHEWVARDGRDSGVVMMTAAKMAAAKDSGSSRRQQQQRWKKAVDKDGMQDWVADHKGEGQEWVANNNGIRH